MMKWENGRVLIDISLEEWERLLLLMGYAAAARRNNTGKFPADWIRLINSIAEGSPDFKPYEIPEGAE